MLQRAKSFYKYRTLLKELVGRDFKLKYRRSILGYAWSLLNPLFTMLVMTAVFSNIFRFSIEKFPVYFLLGQVIWSFYSDGTNAAMISVFGNAELIKKVYVPKYMFPLSKICFSFVNLICSLGAVIIVMIIEKVWVKITIVLLPLLFAYAFFIVFGIGMILSVAAVFFRDLIHIYGVFLVAQMYLTPLFYPVDILPDWVFNIVKFNPVYYLVNYFREIALYGIWPSMQENVICMGFGTCLTIIGIMVFKKYQKKFILYI